MTCADYAAQMLLGRMRKAGLTRVRHTIGDVTSVWELTAKGAKVHARLVAEAAKDAEAEAVVARFKKGVWF